MFLALPPADLTQPPHVDVRLQSSAQHQCHAGTTKLKNLLELF